MNNSTLRRNLVFVAGWVLAGLAIALLVNQLWLDDKVPPAIAPAPSAILATKPSPTDQIRDSSVAVATPVQGKTVQGATFENPAPVIVTQSYAPAVRASAPAVVSVYTLSKVRLGGTELLQTPEGLRRVPRERMQEGLGSGVIIDARGNIVTNYHVVKGADQIAVQLADGRSVAARIVGTDEPTDLAVLRIDLPRLPVMTLGRSDRVEVGDVVLAIGNPYGLSQTVTQGIVSATGRAFLGAIASLENFIQTDAAINRGNSGGALVNSRGELVGINTAVVGQDEGAGGLGFAIPVDLVRGVMQEILQHGRVVRGWIGIKAELITDADPRAKSLPYRGLVVTDLAPNSTAREAGGLVITDKIETIDGQPVRTTQDVGSRIASHKPGSSVTFTGMRRDGQPYSAVVKVIDDPSVQ